MAPAGPASKSMIAPESTLKVPLLEPPAEITKVPLVTWTVPELLKVPVIEESALSVRLPPLTVSAPEHWMLFAVWAPEEMVTVTPEGMVTMSLEVGTASLLQLEAVPQSPLPPAVQLTCVRRAALMPAGPSAPGSAGAVVCAM